MKTSCFCGGGASNGRGREGLGRLKTLPGARLASFSEQQPNPEGPAASGNDHMLACVLACCLFSWWNHIDSNRIAVITSLPRRWKKKRQGANILRALLALQPPSLLQMSIHNPLPPLARLPTPGKHQKDGPIIGGDTADLRA